MGLFFPGIDIEGSVLEDRALVAKADDYGSYAEVELAEGADPQVILQRLVEQGVRLTRFELAEPSLHKIFVDLVGQEAMHADMVEEAHV